jgi:hypothetical protein
MDISRNRSNEKRRLEGCWRLKFDPRGRGPTLDKMAEVLAERFAGTRRWWSVKERYEALGVLTEQIGNHYFYILDLSAALYI